MDAVFGDISLVVDNVPVIVLHASVGWQSVSPDINQSNTSLVLNAVAEDDQLKLETNDNS